MPEASQPIAYTLSPVSAASAGRYFAVVTDSIKTAAHPNVQMPEPSQPIAYTLSPVSAASAGRYFALVTDSIKTAGHPSVQPPEAVLTVIPAGE